MPARVSHERIPHFGSRTNGNNISPTRCVVHERLPIRESHVARMESVRVQDLCYRGKMNISDLPFCDHRRLGTFEIPLRENLRRNSLERFSGRFCEPVGDSNCVEQSIRPSTHEPNRQISHIGEFGSVVLTSGRWDCRRSQETIAERTKLFIKIQPESHSWPIPDPWKEKGLQWSTGVK